MSRGGSGAGSRWRAWFGGSIPGGVTGVEVGEDLLESQAVQAVVGVVVEAGLLDQGRGGGDVLK